MIESSWKLKKGVGRFAFKNLWTEIDFFKYVLKNMEIILQHSLSLAGRIWVLCCSLHTWEVLSLHSAALWAWAQGGRPSIMVPNPVQTSRQPGKLLFPVQWICSSWILSADAYSVEGQLTELLSFRLPLYHTKSLICIIMAFSLGSVV